MSNDDSTRVRIAINGGRFAGAIVTRGLLEYPQLDVRIYELALTFRERGAAGGLARNALRALKTIDTKLRSTLDEAGGVSSNATTSIIGGGNRAGETVVDIAALTGSNSNKRSHCAPCSLIHITLNDSTNDTVDGVIGADGVHGYDCRNLVPIHEAIGKIAAQYVDLKFPQQHAWLGGGGFLMHDIIDNGEVLQCVATVRDERDWDHRQWKRPLAEDELLQKFGSWFIGRPMVEMSAFGIKRWHI